MTRREGSEKHDDGVLNEKERCGGSKKKVSLMLEFLPSIAMNCVLKQCLMWLQYITQNSKIVDESKGNGLVC